MKEITARFSAGLTSYEAVEVARKRVASGPFLIKRHGSWFRPEAKGYTPILSDAGVFDADAARDYLCVEGLSVVPLESLRERIEEEISDLEERQIRLIALLEKIELAKPGEEE